jgi:hypothetical protein
MNIYSIGIYDAIVFIPLGAVDKVYIVTYIRPTDNRESTLTFNVNAATATIFDIVATWPPVITFLLATFGRIRSFLAVEMVSILWSR